jgi:hypothetical protein
METHITEGSVHETLYPIFQTLSDQRHALKNRKTVWKCQYFPQQNDRYYLGLERRISVDRNQENDLQACWYQ